MIKVDLHVHTTYSGDSEITAEQLIAQVPQAGIDCVAVVDHNTAEGSLKLASMTVPFKVIPGEEILTPEGEVIGFFLKETIPPGLSPEETIKLIHEQGGLACIPHPFDRFRSSAMKQETLERILPLLDIIEIANSRTLPFQDMSRPEKFAAKYAVPVGAGSDAHIPEEIGRAYVEIADFTGPEEFLAALRHGKVHRYQIGTGTRIKRLAGRLVRKLGGRR